MKQRPKIWLIVALMMFPQIVETIYSPVLPHLADSFNVDKETAAQTLSIYFIAFAFGVVFWGRMADIIGRRKAMLAGLLIYGVGAGLSIVASDFTTIIIARVICAFGAAVGSVVTQTMLRDSYKGLELAKIFSIMGMGISISPVIGLISGGFLAEYSGYQGIFSVLAILAMVLLVISIINLPETRPKNTDPVSLFYLLKQMLRDLNVWRNAILVALFNLMLFSYYSLAPFIFSKLELSSIEFGYSGIVLAIGSLAGSIINKKLLCKKMAQEKLLILPSILSFFAAIGVYLLQETVFFLVPMILVVISFGIAIPNILSDTLIKYKQYAGTAGAVFGLIYYLILGGALVLVGLVQNLGSVLIVSAIICLLCSLKITGVNSFILRIVPKRGVES